MSEEQINNATNECGEQSTKQAGKGGAVVTCYLTFGNAFSTDDTAMVRAVFKCMMSKPEKAPGGSAWEKSAERELLTSKQKFI